MWSVRMRAEKDGMHVSGAERLVKENIQMVLLELYKRPREYDKMVITIEKVEKVHTIEKALPIYSYDFNSVKEAHRFAVSKLVESGVSESIAWKGIELLTVGPNPKGGNMRGAVLMDASTGERLEDDQERGIRTVMFDWKDRKSIEKALKERGIKAFYLKRLLDALALATKNIYCGVLAELCWSDDPIYTTGYVASPKVGYVRIKPMKEIYNPIGGRVYFVNSTNLEKVKSCLERTAVIVENL